MLIRSGVERGDTIIEVLFAVTIFSLVAIGGMSIMNQGTSMAQRSLEIGLVRQQIDEQADALKYLNQAYVADYGKRGPATTKWKAVIFDSKVTEAQDFDKMVTVTQRQGLGMPVSNYECQIPPNAFALDVSKLDTQPKLIPTLETATYARVRHDDPARAEGIWIQAVRSPERDNRPGFYDFHIRACWFSPGQASPVTLGTIVRLYEPRG